MIAAVSDLSPAQLIVLVGTILSGVAACITAYAAVLRAKKEERTEAEVECLERLRDARRESDAVFDELHELRQQRRAAG